MMGEASVGPSHVEDLWLTSLLLNLDHVLAAARSR